MNQTEQMREALREAMGWNWLDGDVPDSVVKKCEQALAAKQAPAVAQEPVRLNDDDLTKIYMRFVGYEGLSPRLFEDIAGCVMTAMLEKSPAPTVAVNSQMLKALYGLLAIVSDSEGVAGYHLNGAIAKWGEFEEVEAAGAAIAAAEAAKKGGV